MFQVTKREESFHIHMNEYLNESYSIDIKILMEKCAYISLEASL